MPKESIRTFYIDQSWFKVYIDGAISIAEHYDEGDTLREAVKTSVDTYLKTALPSGILPQIPKWGILIRSDLVAKFPDLRISAPWPTDDDDPHAKDRMEVLRFETIDQDLLLILFDRAPENNLFKEGITLHPPEHQLTSMFGGIEGLVDDAFTLTWVRVFRDLQLAESEGATNTRHPDPTSINVFNQAGRNLFDTPIRTLITDRFSEFARQELNKVETNTDNSSSATAALVAAELLARVPAIVLQPASRARGVSQLPGPGVVVSSRSRPWGPSPFTDHEQRPYLSTKPIETPIPPPSTSQPPPNLPTSHPSGDFNPILEAIARTDLQYDNDASIRQALFPAQGSSDVPIVSPQPNYGIGGDCGVGLSTNIFNVRCPYYNTASRAYEYKTALISAIPMSLGLTTDMQIFSISVSTGSTGIANLQKVDYEISVGTTHKGLLASFPALLAATANTPTQVGNEYDKRPTYSGYKIPNVRFTGRGNRWLVRTSYTPETSTSAGTFRVTLIANNGDIDNPNFATGEGYWDIVTAGGRVAEDLSFVVEDVQLNWYDHGVPYEPSIDQETYVTETYAAVSRKFHARSRVLTRLNAVNVSQKALTVLS